MSAQESIFRPLLDDIETAAGEIADVAGLTWHTIDGGTPHLVIFIEGRGGIAAADHPLPQLVRGIAENYRFAMEFQHTRLEDGTPLFGILIYEPFPTLEICWVAHPYEAVNTREGAWTRPVADLSDVARISREGNGETVTLVLTDQAARRIDYLSELQGHRTYRLRGSGIDDADNLATYTWIPGLRTIPEVPDRYSCLPRRGGEPWAEEVSAAFLLQQAEIHAAARQRIQEELDLPDRVSWTVAAARPPYDVPLFAWLVHQPVDGTAPTQVPWYRADTEAPQRWARLAPATSGGVTAPIPAHWTIRVRQSNLAALLPESVEDPAAQAEGAAFMAFLRQHVDREIAIVMNGEVMGTTAVSVVQPDSLPITGVPDGAAQRLAARWNPLQSGDTREAASESESPPATAPEAPDRFQVRLMAEPQDRELIPVTHFEAPGSPGNVVVAVRNEVILDGRAVTGTRLEERNDNLYMRVLLTPGGQESLDGACFSNLGKQLAIVYDGKLICAPTITEWDGAELVFKGLIDDWPVVARDIAGYLNQERL